MKVEKNDFKVFATTPKGNTQEISSDKFYEVVLKKNPKGKGVLNILACTRRMKNGEEVAGEDLNLPNWKFKAELL